MSAARLSDALGSIVGPAHVATGRPRFDLDEVPLACPASTEETAELLRFATRDALRVVPIGLGSKLGWCGAPTRVDFLLSTRRLVGAVSHEPADGTLCVRAGETMAELGARVERGGHRLTPDVALPERCTIGGVVAAGQSGHDRLRFGPLRHHVLGMEVVLGDGTITRTGGQLVKNVTGFDLQRLYAGSHGTLCAITELSLRLFPAPEHEVVFIASGPDLPRILERARAVFALPARLVSLVLTSVDSPPRGEGWALVARLFGKRAAVEAEKAALARRLASATVKEGRDASQFAASFRDTTSFLGAERASLSASCAPSRAVALAVELARLLDERGFERRIVFHPFEGLLECAAPAGLGARELSELARGARSIALRHGGELHVRNAPLAALERLDPFADEVPGLELMRELKRKLDPGGVFASGRFAGGL